MTNPTFSNPATSESSWPLPGGRKVFVVVLFFLGAIGLAAFDKATPELLAFLGLLASLFFGVNGYVHRLNAPSTPSPNIQPADTFDHPPTSHTERGF